MRPIGPQSRPERLSKLDGRTKLAKLERKTRADLIQHVGGNPSATQMMLIEQASMLQMRINLMDRKTIDGVEMTDHDVRHYLAWCNSLARLLRQLGLKGAPQPKVTLADHLSARGAA